MFCANFMEGMKVCFIKPNLLFNAWINLISKNRFQCHFYFSHFKNECRCLFWDLIICEWLKKLWKLLSINNNFQQPCHKFSILLKMHNLPMMENKKMNKVFPNFIPIQDIRPHSIQWYMKKKKSKNVDLQHLHLCKKSAIPYEFKQNKK